MPGRPWVNARKHRHTHRRRQRRRRRHTQKKNRHTLLSPPYPPHPLSKYTGTPGNATQGEECWLAVRYKGVAHVHA